METISALLVVCAGNSPVTGEFPTLRQEAQSFDVFMIGAWTNGWESNRDAGDLRGHCGAHYYVTVMNILYWIRTKDIHISCNVHHGSWWSGGMSSYSIPISASKGLVFLSNWLLCVTLPFEEPELEVTSMAEIKNPKQSKSNTKYNRKNNDNTEIYRGDNRTVNYEIIKWTIFRDDVHCGPYVRVCFVFVFLRMPKFACLPLTWYKDFGMRSWDIAK